VDGVWSDHVIASGLVTILPPSPIATHLVPLHALSQRKSVVFETWFVHVSPSGLVMMTPALPTATYSDPPNETS